MNTKTEFRSKPLKKCSCCKQWKGRKTFIDNVDHQELVKDVCRLCRQKGLK
jgi:hypothetical protein